MTNSATKQKILPALGLALVLCAAVGGVSAADLRVDLSAAAPPAVNERYPRPGDGFGWPPSFWNEIDPATNPAPATTPDTPNYEQIDSLPWIASSK